MAALFEDFLLSVRVCVRARASFFPLIKLATRTKKTSIT